MVQVGIVRPANRNSGASGWVVVVSESSSEEIVNLVLFLSSDKNTYITGQSFIIDGGFVVK